VSETKNLYQKIRQVMKDVEYLSKDGEIRFGTTNYKAISEEKVTSTLRTSLIANGLVILPFEQVAGRTGNVSTVNTKYKIIDIDSGQFEVLASSGEGADTQDKGVGKAMTYAYKYMLLRTFAIPTGEDPDKISSSELDEKQRKAEEEKRIAEEADDKKLSLVKAKWQTLAGNLDGFDDWHTKNKNNGVTNAAMNELLAKKLLDKKEAQPA
jgi:hypothetical protein